MLDRRRFVVLAGVLGVGGLGGAALLWFALPGESVEDRLRAGLTALDRGDAHVAERAAARLERDGHSHHARLIRGKRLYLDAETHVREAAEQARLDRTTQALELSLRHVAVAGGGGASPAERLLVTAGLQFRPSLPGILGPHSRSRAAFTQAHAELSRIREGSRLWLEASELDARCLFHLGELRAAAAVLAARVKEAPEHPESHRLLAIIYYDLGAMEQAVAHAETLARLEPANGQPHRLIGMINRDYYQVTAAVDAYRASLARRLEPRDRAEVARHLAELLIDQLSKYEEALDALTQAPAEFEQHGEIPALRAECLWNLQRRTEARTLAEAALKRDPDSPRALRLLALMELDEERPAAAIDLLEKAVRLDPQDHKNRDRLAAAYRQAGRVVLAEEQERMRDRLMAGKERLTRLNRDALQRPFDDQVRLEVARVWLELDRPREARMWLRAALACNPKNESARELLQRLGGLGGP